MRVQSDQIDRTSHSPKIIIIIKLGGHSVVDSSFELNLKIGIKYLKKANMLEKEKGQKKKGKFLSETILNRGICITQVTMMDGESDLADCGGRGDGWTNK